MLTPSIDPPTIPEEPTAPWQSPQASKAPEELLSSQAVSRKLDVNYARLFNLLHDGTIKPDFAAHGGSLFRKSRLRELRNLLRRPPTYC